MYLQLRTALLDRLHTNLKKSLACTESGEDSQLESADDRMSTNLRRTFNEVIYIWVYTITKMCLKAYFLRFSSWKPMIDGIFSISSSSFRAISFCSCETHNNLWIYSECELQKKHKTHNIWYNTFIATIHRCHQKLLVLQLAKILIEWLHQTV